MSASRGNNSRSGGARPSRQSDSYSTAFEDQKNDELTKSQKSSGKKEKPKDKDKTFSQKRKSVEVLNEKYSPIKEAKGKDEHSLEEEKPSGEGGDDDYSSVDNSESTLKHKYSNALGGAAGSKSK